MTEEQKAAYIHAQAVCAQLEMEGMLVANRACEMFSRPHEFGRDDFMKVMEKYVIGHNDVVGFFHD